MVRIVEPRGGVRDLHTTAKAKNTSWRVAAGAFSAVGAAGAFAAGMVIRSVTRPPGFPFTILPDSAGLAFEDVEFRSRSDSKRLGGWFIPSTVPREPGSKRFAVIVVQGWNRHRADEELKTIEIYAGLAERGLDVFAIDLRGRGTSERARNQFGDTEYNDVLGAYDWLCERLLREEHSDRDAFAVGVFGFSMGAAVVILAAANEPGIGSIVADSPYADVRELIRREARVKAWMPAVMTQGVLKAAGVLGLSIGAYRPIDVIDKIPPRSLLLVHGEQDLFVPIEHTVRLANRANGGADVWLLTEAGHVGGYYCRGGEYLDRVAAALKTDRAARPA
jgi:fermentation-respiration switch protein FrsA (DUF1100 family)